MPSKKLPSPKVRKLLKKGLSLNHWLATRLDNLEIQKTRRKIFAVACFDQAIEHQLAICHLAMSNINGSAFALARPAFESFIRGVWLLNCATDRQLTDYRKDIRLPELRLLIGQIEKGYGFESGVLNQIKSACWSAMCSYTHTGIMQASRRHTKDTIEPDYQDEEIIEVIRLVGTCALLAFQQIASIAGELELANEATGLLTGHISNHKI